MFQTPSKRKREKPESNTGEKIVETAGYLSIQQRVEKMVRAGERLALSRNYDGNFDDDDDSFLVDPTRSGNFDLSDATEILREAESNRMQRRQEAELGSKPDKETKENDKESESGTPDLTPK